MYGQTECDKRLKRDNAELQQQLDDLREYQRRDQEEREREYRDRKQEREAAYRERLANPADWPQAFQSGLYLIRNEARDEASDPDSGHLFADWYKEVERAAEIYHETMAEIEQQIVDMRAAALNTVADKLAAEMGKETETCTALRENRPSYLTYW